jgi:hypothetical protein
MFVCFLSERKEKEKRIVGEKENEIDLIEELIASHSINNLYNSNSGSVEDNILFLLEIRITDD